MWLLWLFFVAQTNVSNSNNIFCIGHSICDYGEYECNQNEHCYITCSGLRACQYSTFICPVGTYDCIINVDGSWNIMVFSFINATLMDGGNLLLHISSTAANAMTGSSIHCPANGDCNITQSGGEFNHAVLSSTTIKAQPTTNILYIEVSSNNALTNAAVLCPENNACIIHASGSGNTMIEDLHIYSVESFNNVQLTCNYSTSITSNCYSINSPPVIHCTESFMATCQLTLVNGTYNNFHCVDNRSKCDGGYEKNATISNTTNIIHCFGYQTCLGDMYYCAENKDCYIYCIGRYSCTSSTIFCPTGKYDCGITVAGANAFEHGRIDATSIDGGNLFVLASGQYDMASSVIKCPSNGDCNVTGNAHWVFNLFTIIAQPTTKMLHVQATGNMALWKGIVVCENISCIIHVYDGTQAIQNLRIYSSTSLNNVNLICEGSCWSGMSPTYYYPGAYYPTIYCTEYYQSSCRLNLTNGSDGFVCMDESLCDQHNITMNDDAKVINCLTNRECENANITCDDYKDCYINCHAGSTCESSNIMCPSNSYDCSVMSIGNQAMKNSVINASSTGGNLFIYASGNEAVSYATVICPHGDCNITELSYQHTYFVYESSSMMESSTIITQPTTNILYIEVLSDNALYQSHIFCPATNVIGWESNCIINATTHSYDDGPFNEMNIYAIESFRDVSLICAAKDGCYGSMEEVYYNYDYYDILYQTGHEPIIHCTYGYKAQSRITAFNSSNDWYCLNTTSICANFSSPTFAPTVDPTISPTIAQPTMDPSTDPTIDPTNDPTSDPTTNPTQSPTQSPTSDPTTNPTTNPTNTPSFSPSFSPSSAPTTSPTACWDFNIKYNSNDGIDKQNNIKNEINLHYVNYNHSSIYVLSSSIAMYFQTVINCTDQTNTDYQYCIVRCRHRLSCLRSNIQPISKYLSSLTVICDEQYACEQSIVKVSYNSSIENVMVICNDSNTCPEMTIHVNNSSLSIICNAAYSCKQSVINVFGSQHSNISIICAGKEACSSMVINIKSLYNTEFKVDCSKTLSCNHMHIYSISNYITANISCYNDNSCDNMHFESIEDKDSLINIDVFRYSKNIFVRHSKFNNINVNCVVSNESLYIRYNSDNLMSEHELLLLAQREYSSNRLPCQSITIDCSKDHKYKSCSIQYEFTPFDFSKIIQNAHFIDCWWIDISDIFSPFCDGTCGTNLTYFLYNISFDLDINVIINEIDGFGNVFVNSTESFIVCDELFGNINVTTETLNNIDAIYDTLLSLYSQNEINDMTKPTQTILRNNLNYLECETDASNGNNVPLSVSFTIESTVDDPKQIDKLFEIHSVFYNKSLLLIEEYFDFTIVVQLEDNEIIINNTQNIIIYRESRNIISAFIFEQSYIWTLLIFLLTISFILIGCVHKQSANFCGDSRCYRYPFNSIDDFKFTKVVIYSIQVLDFGTDLNFIYEIMRIKQDTANIIVSLLSLLFLTVSYIINIKQLFRIQKFNLLNSFVHEWFNSNGTMKMFFFMLLISGSLYHTFLISNCGFWGLNIFLVPIHFGDSTKLSSFKLKYLIIIENIPQILIQLIWSIYFNDESIYGKQLIFWYIYPLDYLQ
eukprot:155798_1